MAPEIIAKNENKRATVEGGKRADVYSLAMVMCEVGSPCLCSPIRICDSGFDF